MDLEQGRQQPLFDFSTRYTHVMNAMFDSGAAVEMGGSRFLLWVYLRLNTDFHTGIAHPSVKKMCEKMKKSKTSILEQLKKLRESGWIEIVKINGRNHYKVIDKFQIKELSTEDENSTIDYVYKANEFMERRQDLEDFKNNRITSSQLKEKGINITYSPVILNYYSIQGDNNTINNVNSVKLDEGMNPQEIAAEIDSLINDKRTAVSKKLKDKMLRDLNQSYKEQTGREFLPASQEGTEN